MYESFFGLRLRPFVAPPAPSRYFPAASIDHARQVLARCIDRAEGTGLVTAAPGTGKSLLLQVLAEQFAPRFATAVIAPGQVGSRRELLQTILYELKLPCRGLDDGELRLALVDFVRDPQAAHQGLLLLVDDAHTLPPPLLEDLRILGNINSATEPRVRLVLAGNPSLDERLTAPELEACAQSVAVRCYLEAFDRGETADYIRFQLAACEANPSAVLENDGAAAVYHATGGIPRLVNQVLDGALLLAWQRGEKPVTARHVQEAWAEMQQLPVAWPRRASSASTGDAAANVPTAAIEFGVLEDEDSPMAPQSAAATGGAAEGNTSELPHSFSTDPAPTAEADGTKFVLPEQLASGGAPAAVPEAAPLPAIQEADPFASFGEEVVLDDRYARLDSNKIPVEVRQVMQAARTTTQADVSGEAGPADCVHDKSSPRTCAAQDCAGGANDTAERDGAANDSQTSEPPAVAQVGQRPVPSGENDPPDADLPRTARAAAPSGVLMAGEQMEIIVDPYRDLRDDEPPADGSEAKFEPQAALAEIIRLRSETATAAGQEPPSVLEFVELNGDEVLVIEEPSQPATPPIIPLNA